MVVLRGAQARRGIGRLALGLTAGLAVVLLGASPRAAAQPPSPSRPASSPRVAASPETRALWVLRQSLTTPERVDQLVRQAAASGFNTLLLQVRARGDAFFAGSIEPRGDGLTPGFDPLAHALVAGHRAGLRIHAWMNINLVASATLLPTDPAHVMQTHPEWLMLPRELAPELVKVAPRSRAYVGRLAAWTRAHAQTVEGIYTSPISPEAARYVESIVADVSTRYAIDGLHLDYIRYPGPRFDFSASALAAFRRSVVEGIPVAERRQLDARLARAPLVYVDRYPQRWADYRRHRLTDLVARLRAATKTRRPKAVVSAAVVPDGGQATRDRYQEWPDWARRGLVDALCPMAYTADAARFTRQIGEAGAAAHGQEIWAGVGAYRMTPAQTVRHIAAARSAGAQGVVLFSYDTPAITASPRDALAVIGRAAFADAVPLASRD